MDTSTQPNWLGSGLLSFQRRYLAIACFIAALFVPDKVLSGDRVFYSASDFEVTESELQLYMSANESPDGTVAWASPMNVQMALNELFVLKVLSRTALQEGFLTESEQAWIAYYQVALAATKKLVEATAAEKMETVDWSLDAREYYVANKAEFRKRDSISVRSLLISTSNRTALEALTLASELTEGELSNEQFESVVREHSEDPNSQDGAIPQLTKGMTVQEFEDAAFSLEEIGQVSEPVLSRFGAHVIQLLGRNPTEYRTFESVEQQLIAGLKKRRLMEFSNFVRTGPNRNPPQDVVVHQEDIDQFLGEIAAQHKANRAPPPTQ